ncbi:MAG TPA: DoxX family protein [Noviherbaspirillum sp.]
MATASSSDDLGKLILRLALGILILLHGIAKLTGGVGFIAGMLGKMGMPEALAYLVYVGEVLAPALLIIGLWTRPAALIVEINMVVAIWLVHMGELFQLTKTGGWALELQGIYLATALAIALLGAGRYSVGGVAGKWN